MGTISDLLPFALRQFERDYGDKIEFVYPKRCVQRRFHDFARNGLVEEFLESDADLLWFIDSDVVPPPHALDLVTVYGDQWDLAGCPYPVFMQPAKHSNPKIVFCVYTRDEKGLHAARVPQEGQAFVDGLATGCMFIKRDIFSKLKKPYFEFKFREDDRHMSEGEDLGFCLKVNDLGYKFFTDYSMVCKHYKTVDLLELNNYAIEQCNIAVENYDAYIRPKVEKLAEKLRAKATPKKESSLIRPSNGLILPD